MNDFVDVIPLGGLGEFGMNCTVLRSGSDLVVIDAGMAFPRGDHGSDLGVQAVVPDFAFLKENRDQVRAVILTHGHEDHAGAVSFLLQDLDVPVFGSRLTLGLVGEKLKERRIGRQHLNVIGPRHRLDFGPFKIETLNVTHSYPESFCLAIDSPAGCLMWTGDFKFDPTPIDGKVSDLHRLAAYGEAGVTALFSDSTNSTRPGLAPSEVSVIEPLRDIFRKARRKIIASTFASSIHRIQILTDLAAEFGRSVVPLGRSMITNIRIAQAMGYLNPSQGVISPAEASELRPEKVLILASGSQAEPMSALTRLAVGQIKNLEVEEEDTVILSTRIIPGNERPIARLINLFYRKGARVYDSSQSPVHVSGHGYRDDLKLMMNLTRPRFFVPIHGEYQQLKTHCWIAQEQGIPAERMAIVENGDVLRIQRDGIAIVDRIHAGRRFIDEGALEEVHETVLRERRYLAEDGFVMVLLQIDRQSGELMAEPDIVSRGFRSLDESEDLVNTMKQKIVEVMEEISLEEKLDEDLLNEILRKELRRILRKRTGKRPLVLSMAVEV
ncbi:MAG: ribonuclease J [Acidobacteriota bacterium]